MKKFKFTINGNVYEVEINDLEDNIAHLEVNGTAYEVEIHREIKQTKTPTLVRPEVKGSPKPVIERKEAGTTSLVNAPLPGNIVDIFVKPGDILSKGQKIMTMESMKMENSVMADKKGVVESILVSPGQSVLQGDPLIEIV